MEKPYNHRTEFRRKLAAGKCSDPDYPGSLNLMNKNTEVSQEDFERSIRYNSAQTDANSGCDLDFYGDGNSKNVFTNKANTDGSKFWRAKFVNSKFVGTILLIENTHNYSPDDY